jgi:flagellar protein FlgJ
MDMSPISKNAALLSMDTKTSIDMAKVEQSAKDFEAMFVTELMRPMFDGLETGGMFGGGKTEEVFRGLLLDEYGKMMADTGQLGIADFVKAEMIAMQEKASGMHLAQNLHENLEDDASLATGE